MIEEKAVCATCRFSENYDEWQGFLTCLKWKKGYGVGPSDLPPNEVLVENDEGWGMVCGPQFGCVLHERSEGKL